MIIIRADLVPEEASSATFDKADLWDILKAAAQRHKVLLNHSKGR